MMVFEELFSDRYDIFSLGVKVIAISLFLVLFATIYAYYASQSSAVTSNSQYAQLQAYNSSFAQLNATYRAINGSAYNLTTSFDPHPSSNSTQILGIDYSVIYNIPIVSFFADIILALVNVVKVIGGGLVLVDTLIFTVVSTLSVSGLGIFGPLYAIAQVAIGILIGIFVIAFIVYFIWYRK